MDISMAEFTTVGVVGGGTMGSGIAYELIRMTQVRVIVRDVDLPSLDRARVALSRYIDRPVNKGIITREQADAWQTRLSYTTELGDLADAEIVIEAVFEDLDLKRSIFAMLDDVCRKDAMLASNTSGLSITSIAAACENPGRVLGLHFFNPVPAMKLIEIVRAYQTEDTVIEQAREFCAALGKEAVLAKDYPGFITTRIGMAMLAEGIRCLEEGVGTASDIDKAIRLGYNFPMGPLELADLIGIDVLLHILDTHTHLLGERFLPSPLLRQMVAAGHLGRKSGRGFYEYEKS
jgi:3-hydroxybutyryl-CoA dehydrogenase